MASEDTLRRLARLKARRTQSPKSDEYLTVLLEDALAYFLDYTHRTVDPGDRIDGMLCRLAVVWSNQEGVEGTTVSKDGDMERQWPEAPSDIQRQMRTWRIVAGLAETLEVRGCSA